MNLFKTLLAAARLRPHRPRIVLDRDSFATDRYLARSAAEFTGGQLHFVNGQADLARALDEATGVVALSHTDPATGALRDAVAITEDVHRHGALMVWDLSQSAGALDVNLRQWDADFAIGCGNRFLGGGSAAPAYCYITERHQADLRRADPNPFCPGAGFGDPTPFTAEFVGTPSAPAISELRTGLSILDRVSPTALAAKTAGLVTLFLERLADQCGSTEISVIGPPEEGSRGTQISLRHSRASAIVQGLAARGVIVDAIEPDVLRFSFAPSWVRYLDVWEAVNELHEVLREVERRLSLQR